MSTIENSNSKHDYERGEGTHPMSAEPMCAVCGLRKNAPVHK
jgi:hypothetical protein